MIIIMASQTKKKISSLPQSQNSIRTISLLETIQYVKTIDVEIMDTSVKANILE